MWKQTSKQIFALTWPSELLVDLICSPSGQIKVPDAHELVQLVQQLSYSLQLTT